MLRRSLGGVVRECRSDLAYLWYSRGALVLAGFMLVGAGVALSGSLSNAASADQFFVDQVQLYSEQGVDISEALAAPVKVTTGPDGSEVIDNPLKYDYLRVGEAVTAVSGFRPLLGTILEMVTFVFTPMVFLYLGSHLSLYDRRAGTIKLRAARSSWKTLVAARVATVITAAVAATGFLVGASFALSFIGRWRTSRLLDHDIAYVLVTPSSVSPIVLKLLMCVGVAVVFGLLGCASAAVTGSNSWPMVLGAGVLFVLPFQGTWDPRNLLAAVGSKAFDFWGQFELRPSIPVDADHALVALVGYGAVALVVALFLPRGSRRFR